MTNEPPLGCVKTRKQLLIAAQRDRDGFMGGHGCAQVQPDWQVADSIRPSFCFFVLEKV